MIPPEVEAFVAALPDGWAVNREDGKGRCIEAARLATAVLPRLGVPCKALACDVLAFNALASELFDQGIMKNGWPEGAWSVGVVCGDGDGASLSEPYRKKGFGGHVVVVGEDWFLDLTVEQVSRPQHGIGMNGAVAGPYDPTAAGVRMDSPGGGSIRWLWRPEYKRWRTSPAWRQDLDPRYLDVVVDRLQQEMQDA